jgi:NAD(P)-dependent dehydrogenase (short-subunit alcohol dehydrogenase family)
MKTLDRYDSADVRREDGLDQVFDINVKGVVFGMKHTLAVMRPQGRGAIVNLASVQEFRAAYADGGFLAP